MNAVCSIRTVHRQARQLYSVVIDASTEEAAAYNRPGQYAVISIPGVEGQAYLAFASLPGEMVEFLVKDEGAIAEALCHGEPGKPVLISSIEGQGFDLQDTTGKPVVLVSMGSGLGPLRALIRYFLSGQWNPSSVALLHGSFFKEDVPYLLDVEDWRARGIPVELCLDREVGGRNALVAFSDHVVADGTTVFWIGSRQFGLDLLEVARRKGIDDRQVRSNS